MSIHLSLSFLWFLLENFSVGKVPIEAIIKERKADTERDRSKKLAYNVAGLTKYNPGRSS